MLEPAPRVRFRTSRWLALALCALAGQLVYGAACGSSDTPSPAATGDAGVDASTCALVEEDAPLASPPRHTPRWTFEPWISKDISTTDDTYAFVDGFAQRKIPVGVVVLDSPWETNYHTFTPDPVRYHDFARLVTDLRARGIRVVLWTTAMMNVSSFDAEPGGTVYDGGAPGYAEGAACNFYVDDGRNYFWWKGSGAAVDFTNARARAWWHRKQDAVLDIGIDGYKLDFGDSYVPTDPVSTSTGPQAHQAFSESYYADMLAYGAKKRGAEFVTMVRGWDESYGFAGRFYARPEDAPVVWAGDNRRDFIGLADALETTFRSAAAGYVMLGSDVGGYLAFNDHDVSVKIPFSSEVFARWTAVGALSPLMQLHGQANITPWTVPDQPDQIVAIYKYWAALHHELVPFFYSLAEEAYAGHGGIVRPVTAMNAWGGDYRYALGDALLVAPILAAGGVRDVALPAGARWLDWWDLAGAWKDGGTTLTAYDASDWKKIPLFVREGAIVPMIVDDDVTGFGSAATAGATTVLVFPGTTATSIVVHEENGSLTTIRAERPAGVRARVELSSRPRPVYLRVRVDAVPASATADGVALTPRATRAELDAASDGVFYDGATTAWIKLPAGGATVVVLAM